MKNLLSLWGFFFHGCCHEWEHTGKRVNMYDISFGMRGYSHTLIETRCKNCGKLSSYKHKAACHE